MEIILMEQKIRQTGDKWAFKQLYPHLSDSEVKKAIKETREDMEEQAHHLADNQLEIGKKFDAEGMQAPDGAVAKKEEPKVSGAKIDNKAKHSENSSKQPGKNGDQRGK